MPKWFDTSKVSGPLRDADRDWKWRLADFYTGSWAWVDVWNGEETHREAARRILERLGFATRSASERRYLPPFQKAGPGLAVRARVAAAAIHALREARVPVEEADVHGFRQRPWEGWVMLLMVVAFVAVPIAALVLG